MTTTVQAGPMAEPPAKLDANALEAIAKQRADEMFLKGSGVLKLTDAIRQLEARNRVLRDTLEAARNGLQWYRDTYPNADSGADDEMVAQIDEALAPAPAGPKAAASSGEPRMQRTISRLQKQIKDLKASRDHFRLLAPAPAVTAGASGRPEPAAGNATLRRRVSDQERRLSAQEAVIREWRRLAITAASTTDPEAFNCLRAELSSWAKTYDGSTTNLPAAPAAAVPAQLDDEHWAELYRLREAVKGPDGFATWQDAATDERIRRVKAERALAAPVPERLSDAQIEDEAQRQGANADEAVIVRKVLRALATTSTAAQGEKFDHP